MEKVFLNIHKYGNMSAATTIVALDEARREGRLKSGDIVVASEIVAAEHRFVTSPDLTRSMTALPKRRRRCARLRVDGGVADMATRRHRGRTAP